MSEVIAPYFVANNQLIKIEEFPGSASVNDLTIYEVVRLINGKILFLNDHLKRFSDSFHYIKKTLPLKKEEILDRIQLLCKANGILYGNIKFEIMLKESNTFQFYAYFTPHAYPTQEEYEKGVAVSMTTAARITPGAKIQQAVLRQGLNKIIEQEHVYEIIMIHPEGYITEGSRSNLFMIRDHTVITSADQDVLPGITRKYVLQACNLLNLNIKFQRVTPEELLSMQSLFITGTSPKVLPACCLFQKQFDVQNPILRSIMKKFDEIIEKDLQSGINFCGD